VTLDLTGEVTNQKGCLLIYNKWNGVIVQKMTSDLYKEQPMRKAVLSIIKRFYCKQNASFSLICDSPSPI
jgi:hypothetical protein